MFRLSVKRLQLAPTQLLQLPFRAAWLDRFGVRRVGHQLANDDFGSFRFLRLRAISTGLGGFCFGARFLLGIGEAPTFSGPIAKSHWLTGFPKDRKRSLAPPPCFWDARGGNFLRRLGITVLLGSSYYSIFGLAAGIFAATGFHQSSVLPRCFPYALLSEIRAEDKNYWTVAEREFHRAGAERKAGGSRQKAAKRGPPLVFTFDPAT